MCGIFGFISQRGEGPEIARLRRIALTTQTRGEHAFGLAWLEDGGTIHSFKQPGPASDYLDQLAACRNAVVVVGHCRYATHGSPQDNRNNHPHAAGAGVLVHNGVVQNYHDLLGQYDLAPTGECDSEVFGLLMARCPGTLLHRAAWAATQTEGDLALLGIWRNPARILVARRGRPLCFGRTAGGVYFASLPENLPTPTWSVVDRTARLLAYARGKLATVGGPANLAPTDDQLRA